MTGVTPTFPLDKTRSDEELGKHDGREEIRGLQTRRRDAG